MLTTSRGRDRRAFALGPVAPKEQPPPETLRQRGPQREALWKAGCRPVGIDHGTPHRRSKPAPIRTGAGESLRSATEGAVTAPYARDGTLSEERSLSDNKSSEGTVPVQPAPDLLLTTPLHELHVELGAKMVPFAGYDMPVQYPLGILKEHLHTRACAGLFDVSHMGQIRLTGDNPAAALETLVPGEIQALPKGRMRYSLFTNEQGGILDDLMITNMGDH